MSDQIERVPAAWKEELAELLEASFRDDITEVQLQRLEELVLSEPAARTHAAEYLSVSQALRDWAEASDLIAGGSPLTASAVPGDAPSSVLRKVETALLRRPRMLSLGVAAVVMGILVTALAFLAPPVYRAVRDSMVASPTVEPEFVASIASTFEAEWAGGQIGAQRGSKLQPGHPIKLTSGYVELAFGSGASIVVEGPASLTIADAQQATLLRGRLVARVPAAAKGFTIVTTQGRVVDLGTEFAVSANSQGDVEVHVLEGCVELRSAAGEPLAAGGMLTAGHSAKLRRESGQTLATPIAYDVAGFTRRSPMADAEWTSDSPLPVGRALSLWLSADFGVVQDSKGRVAVWKDRLTGDNRRAENSLQLADARRPALAADGIGGRPALVFDGKASHLVTAQRPNAGEQTIVVVAKPTTFRLQRHQIINTTEAPNYVLELNHKGEVVGRSYDGVRDFPVLTSAPCTANAPLLIALRHSQQASETRLIVNGAQQVVPAASPAEFRTGRLHIGNHNTDNNFFAGQLAEVIIYDTALADEELQLVCDYLSEKYHLKH